MRPVRRPTRLLRTKNQSCTGTTSATALRHPWKAAVTLPLLRAIVGAEPDETVVPTAIAFHMRLCSPGADGQSVATAREERWFGPVRRVMIFARSASVDVRAERRAPAAARRRKEKPEHGGT